MSGFAGVLRLDGAAVTAAELSTMETSLIPHGPDGRGEWREGPLGLIQRQMNITPEDAAEGLPRVTEDVALVLNGRLDHRADLLAALGTPNLKTAPDSALLLEAWRRWGESCVAHMEGDYSFVLWDRRARRLFAAVDALGARTLFYQHRPPWLLFASTPTALLAHPETPRELDETTLAGYLAIRRPFVGETYYANMRQLPAGHVLLADGTGVRLQRYWQAPEPGSLTLARDADYPEALLELLDRAVASRLRSAHPVGIMLSGGLDSSTVAWIAAQQLVGQGGELRAYTSVPPHGYVAHLPRGRYADETPFVLAQAARLANLRPRFVVDDRATPLDNMERWFRHGGLPIHATLNRTWVETLVEQARGEGTRVLLTGQVGNSTLSFSGGGDRLQYLVHRGHWRGLAREIGAWYRADEDRDWQDILAKLPALLPRRWRRAWRRINGAPRLRNADALHPASAHLISHWPEVAQLKGQALRLRGIAPYSENYEATFQALFGVELRDPTRDRRLVDFCLALPLEQFQRDGVSRRLIRRAMTGKLPSELLDQRAKGMQAVDWPERLTVLMPALPTMLDCWAADPLAARLIHLDLLRALVANWPALDGSGVTSESFDWGGTRARKHFQGALGRGLMAGGFIDWFRRDYQ